MEQTKNRSRYAIIKTKQKTTRIYSMMMKTENRIINGIILGYVIRKQLSKTWIFRARKGNEYYGSLAKNIYQDKYNYNVPSSINNTEGQRSREILSSGVASWQTDLSQEKQREYDKRAAVIKHMSGYNLFIKEYILTNY